MVLGMVLDGDGIPVCSEMWPGNTTDVTTLDRAPEPSRGADDSGERCGNQWDAFEEETSEHRRRRIGTCTRRCRDHPEARGCG